MGARPLDVMITGVTGAGKSTTLNTIFQKTVAKVGDGAAPETMELDAYFYLLPCLMRFFLPEFLLPRIRP